ncbi:MAG: hypothetical protein KF772_00660 [Cryobacterium sp.]|nr:hypothetical protein [Cryobacterium sp.]
MNTIRSAKVGTTAVTVAMVPQGDFLSDDRSGRTPTGSLAKVVIIVISVATFGPYVSGGIRTEQVAVYGLLVLLTPLLIHRLNLSGGKPLLLLWVTYIVLASFAVLAPMQGSPYPMGNLLAGYDNILLPLAIMLLIWTTVPSNQARRVLRISLAIIAIAMTLNGLIALASTFGNFSDALRPFWATDTVVTTVADNASEMGRFSGIFNQPAEAGFMYGIGGLAAIYVWRSRSVLLFCTLTVITLGGIVSVSKVFIFGGLPLILFFWLWSQRASKRVLLVLGLPVLIAGIVQSGLLLNWSGLNYLSRLFDWQDAGVLTLLSSGRVGSNSFVDQVLAEVTDYSPLVGVGAGGWQIAYDNAIVESMVISGVLGTIVMILVVLQICLLIGKLRGEDRFFAVMLAILIIGGNLGFSPLTGNRTSAVSWLVISLLVLLGRNQRIKDKRESPEVGKLPMFDSPIRNTIRVPTGLIQDAQ